MNLRIALAISCSLATFPALAAEDVYVIEPVHSQPQWEARHIGFSNQHGSFGKATGKIILDRAARKGVVDVEIDAASIKTFDGRLDAIVKGERFFNVEKFPTLTFKSTSVTFDGDRVVGVDGDLTMIGVTRPVSLKVTDFKCGEQTFNKKPMCAAEATGVIKRSEFGMTNGLNVSNPSDEIKLTIPVEAYLQQPQG